MGIDRRATSRAFRVKYITEVLSELKKVTWPSREEAWRLTVIVLIITVFVGLLMGFFDFIFSRFISYVT